MTIVVASGMFIGAIGISGMAITAWSGMVSPWSTISGIGIMGGGLSVSGNVVHISSGSVFISGPEAKQQPTIEIPKKILDETPMEMGDYKRAEITTIDDALNKAKQYRENGHWTELRKVDENTVAIYISNWKKDDEIDKGMPKFLKNN